MTEQHADKKDIPRLDLIGADKNRLHSLEQDLIATAKGPTIDLSLTEVRKKGLLAVLRKQAGEK